MPQDFEEYNTVTLTDDDGNDIEFELVDLGFIFKDLHVSL